MTERVFSEGDYIPRDKWFAFRNFAAKRAAVTSQLDTAHEFLNHTPEQLRVVLTFMGCTVLDKPDEDGRPRLVLVCRGIAILGLYINEHWTEWMVLVKFIIYADGRERD